MKPVTTRKYRPLQPGEHIEPTDEFHDWETGDGKWHEFGKYNQHVGARYNPTGGEDGHLPVRRPL